MANTIDVAFIKQFESEVHMAYQRMGSKLRNTVRTSGNVRGNTVRFQKIGTGSASTKSRNGSVTPMDELKTNIDERQAVAQSAAAALGRKTDEILYTAMDAGANSTQISATGAAVTKANLLSLFETFGSADIPEDGNRYLAMSPAGYADLFNITEFASSDFVGDQNLPFAGGMTMKSFLGFKIFSTSAITGGKNMAYHTSAIGLGVNADVSTELNYVPEKASHLATSMMSMGAVVINDNGIYEVLDNN